MPTLTIDGKEVTVQAGTTIMRAARQAGVSIPHFCFHPLLSVAGNCRMCLVEVAETRRPVISCVQPVREGMVVKTDSEMVRKGCKTVIEYLLVNHPLDCPVCDQGGECDLQDFAMKYGLDHTRFREKKRQAQNYDLGPLTETEMNRCVHCTRCVRFCTEVAGVEEMGAVNRGYHTQVGPYIEKPLTSELSGNLAEVCPVGALNNKPFHFQARSWELKHAAGVCAHCAVGCQIRVDHLGNQVKRVMAGRCDAINQMWLCDKGRFAYDGLTQERLDAPLVRSESTGGLREVTWAVALDRAAELLKKFRAEEIAGLASDAAQGAEELFAFQDFMRRVVGSANLDHRLRQRDFSGDEQPLGRADLLMNTPLVDLARADVILLVGADPRYEAPLLNVRLRQATRAGAQSFAVHPRRMEANLVNLTQIVVHPGEEVAFLEGLLREVSAEGEASGLSPLATAWRAAKRPVLLLGEYAVNHPQAEIIRRLSVALLERVGALGPEWNGFNRVAGRSNAAAAQDMGVVPHRGPGYQSLDRRGHHAEHILRLAARGEIKVLLLLGCDPGLEAVDTRLGREALAKCRVIYIGAYQTPAALQADVVLPGLTSTERNATLTNAEGRAQQSALAVMGPLQAKEDWRIFRALSDRFAKQLPYNSREELLGRMAEADRRYAVTADGAVLPKACDHGPVTVDLPLTAPAGSKGAGLVLVLESPFYQDDAITRRSAILGKLTQGRSAGLGMVRIHPQEAVQLKLQAGQKVRLVCGERKLECTVGVDANVPMGVVYGHREHAPVLLQDMCDWGGGFPQVSLVGL
ncbi:MAG: NADH-quinone oxidoreductase subunit NuoG [Magnetococcales bacterium]|nr:NADH-quinone oxidoreductase subunit NuoG [Magnetococcales bacterium]